MTGLMSDIDRLLTVRSKHSVKYWGYDVQHSITFIVQKIKYKLSKGGNAVFYVG